MVMDKEVRNDIVSVLSKAIDLIKKEDFISLKEVSNNIIHSASIVQDKYSIQTAVVIYSLSKVLEREKQKDKEIPSKIVNVLQNLLNSVSQNNEKGCDDAIKKILDEIKKIDQALPWHVQRVIEKANIVKGSNMFRHGISVGRVASILGVTQWDLMSYIGKTRIIDKEERVAEYKDRLAFARELFNI
jgi:molecular chaperone GrpE (heat shock protein)